MVTVEEIKDKIDKGQSAAYRLSALVEAIDYIAASQPAEMDIVPLTTIAKEQAEALLALLDEVNCSELRVMFDRIAASPSESAPVAAPKKKRAKAA